MADYRYSAQIIGRSSGRSAVAAAAYRAGISMADERTGLVHDFSRRHGIAHAEIIAPDNAPDWMRDRARLWNAVELAEKRKDSQLAREVQLSLPHELTDAQRLELVRGFVKEQFVSRGMIADFAIHAPGKEGDDRNHHAHVMLTMRELTGEGFGKKERTTADEKKAALEKEREAWANHVNRSLERNQHKDRVDHRSYKRQGVDREATRHMGPDARQIEQRGGSSRIGDENRAIEQRNRARNDNHRTLAQIRADIARMRAKEAQTVAARQEAVRSAQLLQTLDLERRQHRQTLALSLRLDRQYGAQQRTLTAAAGRLEIRLQATGLRRMVRDIIGRSMDDRAELAAIQKTLTDIRGRTEEAARALRQQHEVERAAHKAAQERQLQQTARTIAAEFERKRREAVRERHAAQRPAKAVRILAERVDPSRGGSKLPRPRRQQQPGQGRPALDIARSIKPARSQPEQKPMKRDFDKARVPPVEPPRPQMDRVFVSQPTPAPSPSGEVRQSPREARDVPTVDRVQEWTKTPAGRATAGPPQPGKSFEKVAPATSTPEKNAPAPAAKEHGQSQQSLAPDWATKGVQKQAPTPQPEQKTPEQSRPSLAPDWATKGIERKPVNRDRSRDFDRDR